MKRENSYGLNLCQVDFITRPEKHDINKPFFIAFFTEIIQNESYELIAYI